MAKGWVLKSRDMWFATVLLVALLTTAGSLMIAFDSAAKQKLRERFADRTMGGATFVSVFMQGMLERESRLATRYLSDRVTPQRMQMITETFDSAASVLLDADGKLLASFPHDPAMIGSQVAAKYPHLQAGLEGTPTISPVVMSAVEGIPVVGAAAPFNTESGQRVFSTALSISDTPLAQYLDTMLPMQGAKATLYDATGAKVISREPTAADTSSFGTEGVTLVDEQETFVVSDRVPGTPWSIVSSVPFGSLYAPLDGSRTGAWTVFGLLLVMGLACLRLFARYTHARLDYKHRAHHCPLTGLANRRLLNDHARRELARSERTGGSVGLLYIDLDDFKSINDTLGHEAGDELLIQVADRMREAVRPYDVPARLGGDEFAVLLPQTSQAELETIAKRLLNALHEPYGLKAGTARAGASVGVAAATGARDLDSLLRSADAAMYVAKTTGKGRYLIAPDQQAA